MTKTGIAVGVLDRVTLTQSDVPRDGNAVVSHHRLEQVLVHAEGRGGDTRADVGNAGQLEQSLNRPVLAEGAVEDGKHHVHLAQRGRDGLGRDGERLRGVPGSERALLAAPSCHLPARSIATVTVS